LLYTSQNLLGTIFRVAFTVFYRRIWSIVGKYSILCCDNGGSGVNLMLEETAFDLGYTAFEAMDEVLRMADQSRVNPVGKLSFPMLLGRPWLYSARVLVDWGAK
jgi:hypothetical protein